MEKQAIDDKTVTLLALKGKKITIIGYGNQGQAQAKCFRDSGLDIHIASAHVRSDHPAIADGFSLLSIDEAVNTSAIIHILLPDEIQGEIYHEKIKSYLHPGQALSFSHGFSIVFEQIIPPQTLDVILISPKGTGQALRQQFLEESGIPGFIAVHQNYSGQAQAIALAMAKALGLTRRNCFECSFRDETHADLFGEQAVLCGGITALIKNAFKILTDAGYPAELAYFEVLHELKYTVDLIHEHGLSGMHQRISNTAEWGAYQSSAILIDADTKQRMKTLLEQIQTGTFARQWIAEMKTGKPNLQTQRQTLANEAIERTGREIRSELDCIS